MVPPLSPLSLTNPAPLSSVKAVVAVSLRMEMGWWGTRLLSPIVVGEALVEVPEKMGMMLLPLPPPPLRGMALWQKAAEQEGEGYRKVLRLITLEISEAHILPRYHALSFLLTQRAFGPLLLL